MKKEILITEKLKPKERTEPQKLTMVTTSDKGFKVPTYEKTEKAEVNFHPPIISHDFKSFPEKPVDKRSRKKLYKEKTEVAMLQAGIKIKKKKKK